MMAGSNVCSTDGVLDLDRILRAWGDAERVSFGLMNVATGSDKWIKSYDGNGGQKHFFG